MIMRMSAYVMQGSRYLCLDLAWRYEDRSSVMSMASELGFMHAIMCGEIVIAAVDRGGCMHK